MYMQVSFPSGCFYGAEMFDPSLPEWPPHPSRLFSALVASAYRSRKGMTEVKRKSLEWLESLPPPTIATPTVDQTSAPISFVPPGDIREQKGTKGQEQYEHGILRWRQPRYFPSAVILDKPVIHYSWEKDPEQDFLASLDEIGAEVTHVGTSHSFAIVKSYPGQMNRSPTLVPYSNGTCFLRVPVKGRLKELDAVFKQTAGVRRPTPACEPLVPYQPAKDRPTQGLTSEWELLTLRLSGTVHGSDTASYLAKAVRRAVMSVLGDEAPAAVHGHSKEKHIGWLPLPDVGHSHASGRVVGIGIMIPRDLDSEKRVKVLAGINRIRDVCLPDGRVAHIFSPTPGERLPLTLYEPTWTRPSRVWATVTPVVIDRPPKRLTQDRLRNAFAESLIHAGYPKPNKIEISTFSLFQGAPPAFRVPTKKPRYHAMVQWEQPVAGPVVAGRLRYFGVGLFRPLVSGNAAGGPR